MKTEPPRTQKAEAFTQLILETFHLNGQLLATGDHLSKELNLTSSLWQVMGSLADRQLTVAQIARNMGLTRQSVRRTANILEKKGYITFQENPDHKRAKLVTLTQQGRTVLEKMNQIHTNWANKVAENLNKKGLDSAIQLMKKIGNKIQTKP